MMTDKVGVGLMVDFRQNCGIRVGEWTRVGGRRAPARDKARNGGLAFPYGCISVALYFRIVVITETL
jgi:hypothetical protein